MARKTKITEHPEDPTGIERARLLCSTIPFMPHGWRLLTAFQGLGLPAGCVTRRGNTRTACAKCITETTGLPCTRAWKPDTTPTDKGTKSDDAALVHYVAALLRHHDSKGKLFEFDCGIEPAPN